MVKHLSKLRLYFSDSTSLIFAFIVYLEMQIFSVDAGIKPEEFNFPLLKSKVNLPKKNIELMLFYKHFTSHIYVHVCVLSCMENVLV
jgi:hypothetical protein